MRMKITWIVKGILFTLILLLLYSAVSPVFVDKSARDEIATFSGIDANTVDVLFLGSSRMTQAISPMALWHEFGIASYNLAMVGQTVPQNYYSLLTALESQKPGVVILEINNMYQPEVLTNAVRFRQWMDHTPFSLNKLRAVTEFFEPKDWLNQVFSLLYYHDRWKSLTREDFARSQSVTYGAVLSPTLHSIYGQRFLIDPEQTIDIGIYARNFAYLDRIVALCESREIGLVLVNIPTCYSEPEDLSVFELYNAMAGYAAEKGVPYLNCLYCFEDIGLDLLHDFHDRGHLNVSGMDRFTSFIGRYLADNYDTPDHRGEIAYNQWDTDYSAYQAYESGVLDELTAQTRTE